MEQEKNLCDNEKLSGIDQLSDGLKEEYQQRKKKIERRTSTCTGMLGIAVFFILKYVVFQIKPKDGIGTEFFISLGIGMGVAAVVGALWNKSAIRRLNEEFNIRN